MFKNKLTHDTPPRKGEIGRMSSVKSAVEKMKKLESEKLRLLAEVEELKRMAEAKSDALTDEITALREEISSLKGLIGSPVVAQASPSRQSSKLFYLKELAEKTVNESRQLGSVVFAPPFSQNFESWLASLQKIATDFESDPSIYVDDEFTEDSSRILQDIEAIFTKIKADESNLSAIEKALAYNNHSLVEAEKEYTEKSKELSAKANTEVQNLSNRVQELERQLKIEEEDTKGRKILKRKTDDKVPQIIMNLKSAKAELETAQKNLTDQQNKLSQDYEKTKQNIIKEEESLRNKLDELGTDRSIEARQTACQALSEAVNACIQRNSSLLNNSQSG
jgi:chromosome segregation ATPase